jgi:predicted nucleic acid-binding Zn ribbon protein
MSDPVLTTCPACGAETYSKQVTAAGFQLKGSGWYVTDFRGGNTGAKKEGDAATDKPADAKAGDSKAATSATADSKPSDAKATPAPAAAPAAPAPPAAAPSTGS